MSRRVLLAVIGAMGLRAASLPPLQADDCELVDWAPDSVHGTVVVEGDEFHICIHFNLNDASIYEEGFLSESDALLAVAEVQAIWPRYVEDLGFPTPVFPGHLDVEMNWSGDSCNGHPGIQIFTGCYIVPGAVRKVLIHEMFHEIQSTYSILSLPDWIEEGTARAVEDNLFLDIDNWDNALVATSSFNKEANGYLACTNKNLIETSYASALWWKYFCEQFGSLAIEPERGVDAFVALFEALEIADDVAAVELALANMNAGKTFHEAFRRFVAANLTKDLQGLPDDSFNYVDEEQAGNPAPYGPLTVIDGGEVGMASPVNLFDAILALDSLCPGLTFESLEDIAVSAYGAMYFKAAPAVNCKALTVTFENLDDGPAFYHVVSRQGATLETHAEGSGHLWARSFLSDGIDDLTAIAGSLENYSRIQVTFACGDPSLEIVLPNDQAVARVGPFDDPGKFLAQLLITDSTSGAPLAGGFDPSNFQAKVNGIDAPIVAGGFIQHQYWLVIDAPAQEANGIYNLQILLQKAGQNAPVASDVSQASISYGPDGTDHVLVVDRSGSMGFDDKLEAAQAAASFYVDVSRDGDGLAVVPFHHDAQPAPFPIQTVDALARQSAKTFIAGLIAGGATSIGDGLSGAVTQRLSSPTGNPACSLVLLSDGMENSAEFWADVEDDIVGSGCPVTAIAFGPASDETLMQDIATTTGGAFFFSDVFPGEGAGGGLITPDATALGLADIYEHAQSRAEGRQRILAERGTAPLPPETRVHEVLVDEGISEIVFALDWNAAAAELDLRLEDPSGLLIDAASLTYTFEDRRNAHLGWRLRAPRAGRWRMLVGQGRASQIAAGYQVIASGRSRLTLDLLLLDRRGIRLVTGEEIPIHALLTDDGPVAALVGAIVWSPDGSVTAVPLLDDGQHDDGMSGDGLYGGVFTRANSTILAEPVEDAAAPSKPKPEAAYRVLVRARGEGFQRESTGSFSVLEGADLDQDRLPDVYEARHRLASATGDPDLDGLDNVQEYLRGTEPGNSDSDGGGEGDGSEVRLGQDPLDPSDDEIVAPRFFRATPQDGGALLTYDVAREHEGFTLLQSRSREGPWMRITDLPRDGVFRAEGQNGETLYHRLEAFDGDGHRSAILETDGATPNPDTVAPAGLVSIDGGAGLTCDRSVTLTFHGQEHVDSFEDFAEMAISNDGLFTGSEWQPFAREVAWELAEIPSGSLAQVYVFFRDGAGNVSEMASGAIRLFSPGECPVQGLFERGNANLDATTDISDAIYILGFLFLGNPSTMACEKAGDADDSGKLEITDAIFLLGHLFLGNPGSIPPPLDCGTDPTADSLPCESFLPCGG